MNEQKVASSVFSTRTKLTLIIASVLLAIVVLLQLRAILSPFLWAAVVAYLLVPVVNYLNVRGGLPRLWSILLIYASVALLLVAGVRYLYPLVVAEGTVFLEDIPRLEGALIALVGPRPLGIDIASVITQLVGATTGYSTDTRAAGHLLVNALETLVKLFLFLVTSFYLLMDSRRLRDTVCDAIPEAHRDELTALGRRIHETWQHYIRGELLLFAIMAIVTGVGLTILQVPGAIFLGLASGALELLPLVGPWTAGAIAVSVAYFNGANPWNLSQIAYAGAVAMMYFVLRQMEDYLIIPHVLGRAVRLHPVVVLFAVAAGGVIGGLFGLIIAVPIAASLREIVVYLYNKMLDLPVQSTAAIVPNGDVHVHHLDPTQEPPTEDPIQGKAGTPQPVDA